MTVLQVQSLPVLANQHRHNIFLLLFLPVYLCFSHWAWWGDGWDLFGGKWCTIGGGAVTKLRALNWSTWTACHDTCTWFSVRMSRTVAGKVYIFNKRLGV